MGDHTVLIYPPHGEGGATSDVDNAEAFAFYEINLHLYFEATQKHQGYEIYIHPNLFKRLNIASTLPISSVDMNPPQAGRATQCSIQ